LQVLTLEHLVEVAPVQGGHRRGDADGALLVADGIRRVGHQIHEHLLDLGGVRGDGHRRGHKA